MEEKNERKCFIVTPIGDADSEIRRHIDGIIDQAIIPALQNKFKDIIVAHRKYEVGSITNAIIKEIIEADLVIANLTKLNPNVMFELAIRYSFGKPVIVIAERNTKLPFDINSENTIFYVNDPTGAAELKDLIIKFESNIDYTKDKYGPVYDSIKRISMLKVSESSDSKKNQIDSYMLDSIDAIEGKLDRVLSMIERNRARITEFNDYYNPDRFFISNSKDSFNMKKGQVNKNFDSKKEYL